MTDTQNEADPYIVVKQTECVTLIFHQHAQYDQHINGKHW